MNDIAITPKNKCPSCERLLSCVVYDGERISNYFCPFLSCDNGSHPNCIHCGNKLCFEINSGRYECENKCSEKEENEVKDNHPVRDIQERTNQKCSNCQFYLYQITNLGTNKPFSGLFCDNEHCERREQPRCVNCGSSLVKNIETEAYYCNECGLGRIHETVAENPSQFLRGDASEKVDHPPHYNNLDAKCLDCGRQIECIDVIEQMPFNIGTAIKYLWRFDDKENPEQDLKKAIWYIQRELDRRDRNDN